MNPFRLAWNDFRHRPVTCALVMALIAAATSIGFALTLTERALRTSSARAADRFDLVVGAPGEAARLVQGTVFLRPGELELLDSRVIGTLRADAGVRQAAPLAFGDSFDGHALVGTTPEFITRGGEIAPVEGRLFANEHEAVVGARVAIAVGSKLRPLHGPGGEPDDAHVHAFEFTVVGRLPDTGTPWDQAVLVPYEAMAATHHRDNAGPSAIVVSPRTVNDAYRLRHVLRKQGLLAVFPAEVLVDLYGVLDGLHEAVFFVLRVCQGLVLCAVLLALTEMLRALDAMPNARRASSANVFIAAWFFCVSLFALGVLAGAGAGWVLAHLIGQVAMRAIGLDLVVALRAADWQAPVFQLAALALAAIVPALATMRRLRSEKPREA